MGSKRKDVVSMSEQRIENAQISNVTLSMADHGCLTFWVYLDGGGWGCGFGGYCIGHGYLGADEFKAESGSGLEAMMRIMDTVGVEKWEDLKGKYVRCKMGRLGDGIDEIGNVLKNKWFNIREFFASKT